MMKPMSEEQRTQLANDYWEWFSKGAELHTKTELNLIKIHILKTAELKTLFQKISDYWKIGNITESNHLEQTIKKLILLEDDIKSPFELMEGLKDNITMSAKEKSNIYLKKTKFKEFSNSEFKHKFLFEYFPVCPYCNATYLFKLREENTAKKITNYVGAQLDHYYPKDDFPYLAISIFNLIPSCPTCNHIKSNNKNSHLHPYTEEMGDNAKFTLSMKCLGELEGIESLGFENEFKDNDEYRKFTNGFGESRELTFDLKEGFDKRVELRIKDGLESELKERIENSKKIFQLENKYSGVREEIRDLYFKHKLLSQSQREETLSQFGDSLGITPTQMEEVYFGARKTDEYKRPLSKFINDIRDFLDNEDQDKFK